MTWYQLEYDGKRAWFTISIHSYGAPLDNPSGRRSSANY